MSQWQSNPYIIVLVGAGALSLVASATALRWRNVHGARPLAVVAFSAGLWSLAYALELSATDLATAVFWAQVQYLFIVVVPGSWLVFTARYANDDAWLTPRTVALLGVMPVFTVIAVWTNGLHRLFWTDVAMVSQGAALILDVAHGPLFWLHTAYSYTCLIIGSWFLVRILVRSPFIYRGRLGLLLAALFAPLLGNALYVINLNPFGRVDLTPLAFTISSLAVVWSIVRLRLFNLIPIARSAVLDQMSDAVAVLDEQDQVVDLNTAALKALAVERDEVIGGTARQVFARWPDIVTRYRRTIRVDDELELNEADGRHWYNVRISPLFDDSKQLRGRLLVWRDITAEKDTIAALVEAKEAAEAASRAKTAFLANMSHELRTPLSAILGYSQLMRLELSRGLYDNLPRELESVELAGDHLLRLISNLLQISRIESGRSELQLEEFRAEQIVEDVVRTAQPLIDRKGNQLVVTCGELGMMRSDRVKLHQVLLNLLDNAAKFTDGGTITLVACREPEQSGDWLVFTVSDTGVGISADELPHLFEVFTEPDAEKRRRFGGTGIGLALSRQLCLLMGGEISAGAPSPEGSSFTVRLPASCPPVPTGARGAEGSINGHHPADRG